MPAIVHAQPVNAPSLSGCRNSQIIGNITEVADVAGEYISIAVPSVVWNGSYYGLTWESEVEGNLEIYFGTLTSSGILIGDILRITNATFDSSSPSLVWTGSEYGLAWHDQRNYGPSENYDIYFARIRCE